MNKLIKASLVLCVATGVLTGCLNPLVETEKEMAKIVAKNKAKPLPMPNYETTLMVAYDGFNQRSPFIPETLYEKLKDINFKYVTVNENRNKQYLEKYPLQTLVYHGLIKKKGNISAVLQTPENEMISVSIGQYLGQHNGKLTAINKDFIVVAEAISDGLGRYIEQPVTIQIIDNTKSN